MKITREWCMPNKNTFSIKPISAFIEEEMQGCDLILDPFARDSKLANITNDLNPGCDTDFHLDALDFLKRFDDESVDGVLFDPPYSLRQLKECYDGIGHAMTQHQSQRFFADIRDEISRIMKKGGIVLSFGWNSQGISKQRGFEKVSILMVAHGGTHHDTLCVSEVKV